MHQRSPRYPPRLLDGAVIAAVAVVGLFGLFGPVLFFGASAERVSLAGTVLVVVQAAVLWRRRTQSLPVLIAALAAMVVAQAIGDPNAPSYVGVHAAAYSVGVYASRPHALTGLGALALAAVADAVIVRLVATPGDYAAIAFGPYGLFAVIAWIIGRYVGVRRAYVDMLVSYSHQLERDRDARAGQAVRDERRRIARELHDQVAHHLGVVSLQTSAARKWVDRDAGRTATALAAAEEAARAALQTMPVILHALRADDTPAQLDPQPTLEAVEDLVSRVDSDNVTVELRVDGSRRQLPAAVELAAYRVIQESLTNVVKHAGRADVVVTLRYGRDCLEVEIADDGRGAAATPAAGAGLGLVGMRERVEMLNGALTAGPRPGGGFGVRATLPLTGATS